jgi:hypothetical protein
MEDYELGKPISLISFTNPNKMTWVKIMVAPDGISAK